MRKFGFSGKHTFSQSDMDGNFPSELALTTKLSLLPTFIIITFKFACMYLHAKYSFSILFPTVITGVYFGNILIYTIFWKYCNVCVYLNAEVFHSRAIV